jgi:hypothetical protein
MAKRNSAQDQQLFKIAFLAPKSLRRTTMQGTAADCHPGRRNDSRARPPCALVWKRVSAGGSLGQEGDGILS